MASNPTLDIVGFIFEFAHLPAKFLKLSATVGDMTFDSLLEGPGTFFNLLGVFLQAFEGGCDK
jgi:hypothetical protein